MEPQSSNISNSTTPTKLEPVTQAQRHESMDLIRGIAVLGILVMNIYAFANIYAYYVNPHALGTPSVSDLWVWITTHIFADQKFYTIFSMLFGAGIMLMAQKSQQNNISPAKLHYRRSFILLAFGTIHAIFIWYGDILFTYAFTALWIYLFINTKAKTKLVVGSFLIILLLLMFQSMVAYLDHLPASEVEEFKSMFTPDAEIIAEESAPYLTSYSAQVSARVDFFLQNMPMMALFFGVFKIGGSMLIGMALFQLGIITAQKSTGFYWLFALINFAIGFSLMFVDVNHLLTEQFSLKSTFSSFMVVNSLAAVFVALGYIALICLWAKCSLWSFLKTKLQAVGRMAFTNYINQSLICSIIFYSFGFGLFGQLDRLEQMLVVAAIFAFQLFFSSWWLKRFYFGPLEWLWRSMTYGKLQPLKK